MNNVITLKPKEGVELLAIVVDKDAYDFKINKNFNCVEMKLNLSGTIIEEWLTEGIYPTIKNYSILGTVKYNKPIEFDCDGLLDRYFPFDHDYTMYYKDYKDFKFLKTSKESFISLLEANNINLQQLDKEDKKLVILIKQ